MRVDVQTISAIRVRLDTGLRARRLTTEVWKAAAAHRTSLVRQERAFRRAGTLPSLRARVIFLARSHKRCSQGKLQSAKPTDLSRAPA